MIDFEEVEENLCVLFQGLTGTTFVRGNQPNGARPSATQGVYGTVMIMDDSPNGPGSSIYKENNIDPDMLDEVNLELVTLTVSVQTYYDGARSALSNLRGKVVSYNCIKQLTELGYGFVDRSRTRNLTQPLDRARMEERAQFDLRINVCSTNTEVETTIGSFSVEGVAEKQPDTAIPINFTINEDE
jgi:hypothetical protein